MVREWPLLNFGPSYFFLSKIYLQVLKNRKYENVMLTLSISAEHLRDAHGTLVEKHLFRLSRCTHIL
jgi:hypothetical protein